jgi:hypothetical protein
LSVFVHTGVYTFTAQLCSHNSLDSLFELARFESPIFSFGLLLGEHLAGEILLGLYGIGCGESKSSKENGNEADKLAKIGAPASRDPWTTLQCLYRRSNQSDQQVSELPQDSPSIDSLHELFDDDQLG